MPSIIDERTLPEPNEAEWQFSLALARQAITRSRPPQIADPRATPEPVPQTRLNLAKAGIRHLSAILREMVELWNGPESDEHGILRPTKYAFDEASRILVDAAIIAAREGREIPIGCVSTDSQGGVRVEWVRDNAGVHLAVPASIGETAYVYHELGDKYATADATPETLAGCLRDIA